MAADLAGTTVTVNLLLPGGATATGMIPDDVSAEVRAALLDPTSWGRRSCWLATADVARRADRGAAVDAWSSSAWAGRDACRRVSGAGIG